MVKFDMGAAWDDSMLLLRSHLPLTGTIAAVFLFLPTLAMSWFGPTPIEPAAGASLDQVMAAFQQTMRDLLPYQLLVSVIGAIGGVGILRLWLSRTGTSVGDALVFALKMVPTMIAVQLLLFIMLGAAALLLIVPGVALGGVGGALLLAVGLILFVALAAYFWGRFSVISPIIADQTVYNPLAAVQGSLAVTRGNGWRIFLFMFLVIIVILIAALIIGGVIGIVAGGGEGAGRMIVGLVEAIVGAIGALVSLAITGAVYRQLSMAGTQETFR
jgi:hypothetical protein